MNVQHPNAECPKCGDLHGFLTTRPRYDADPEIGERLIWECDNCGYSIVTDVVTPDPDFGEPPR